MQIGDVADIPTTTRFMDEEHRRVQETARRYAMEEVMPVANEIDVDGFHGETMPPELMYDRPAELGFHGMRISEKYGGAGMGALAYIIATEEVSRAWASAASIFARTQGIGAGTEEQKEKYNPKMVTGDCVGASAITEPNHGSDVASMETTAIKDGNEYVLNGQKMFCTNAKDADIITVYARTDPDTDDHTGISSFILDKERGEFDVDGLTGRHISTFGYHGMNTWELSFDDVRVPEENLIGGEEGKAFYNVMSGFEVARLQTGARAVGAARGALEDALEYAAERKQFGNNIKEYQGIRFKLADMATKVTAARTFLHHVAAQKDDDGGRLDREACMAKLYASEMALDVCEEGIQILGGNGYTMDYPMQRYYRDARLWTIGEGTSEIHKRVIMDRIYGE